MKNETIPFMNFCENNVTRKKTPKGTATHNVLGDGDGDGLEMVSH